MTDYARALGAKVGSDVDLHSLPPVTGMLTIGERGAIEPEVDLGGHWIDGDVVHIGEVRIGAGATRRLPQHAAARRRDRARAPRSPPGRRSSGACPPGERWAGSPAVRVGAAAPRRSAEPAAPRGSRGCRVYGLIAPPRAAAALASPPGVAVVAGRRRRLGDPRRGRARRARWLPLGAVTACRRPSRRWSWSRVRLLGVGLARGAHPVRSRIGWQVWATERLLDAPARCLFPLYSSLFTPVWLRLLGAKVGRGVEASTVLLCRR